MAHGGRRGAAQARAYSFPILRNMVKPGRLAKAAREKAGLERKRHGNSQPEDKDAPPALADELFEEEAELAENEGFMDCEEVISTDPHVSGAVENMIEEAERKAELALAEAEMAAAEAESAEMELDMLLKDLGLRD
ncbi:TY5A [Symbiodinium sp. CCMP2592]|nr:TY5A [Symbiodinium sp. CCMP2592]